jgi:hypothetical protein
MGVIVIALAMSPAAAEEMTQLQRAEAVKNLHWLHGGTQRLPISNSALALPSGYHCVLGEDARRPATSPSSRFIEFIGLPALRAPGASVPDGRTIR